MTSPKPCSARLCALRSHPRWGPLTAALALRASRCATIATPSGGPRRWFLPSVGALAQLRGLRPWLTARRLRRHPCSAGPFVLAFRFAASHLERFPPSRACGPRASRFDGTRREPFEANSGCSEPAALTPRSPPGGRPVGHGQPPTRRLSASALAGPSYGTPRADLLGPGVPAKPARGRSGLLFNRRNPPTKSASPTVAGATFDGSRMDFCD